MKFVRNSNIEKYGAVSQLKKRVVTTNLRCATMWQAEGTEKINVKCKPREICFAFHGARCKIEDKRKWEIVKM